MMKLEQVVPFGRSLQEYILMFDLTESDLCKTILSVADGPASFNAEGTAINCKIRSVDPLYIFSVEQIRDRFDGVVDNIINQIKSTPNNWVWKYHTSLDHLRANRIKATENFCLDYERGKVERRYEVGELPQLKYSDHEYELGLCSHFLFLYSEHLDYQFHLDSICEMLRICQEVRIFPLLTLMLERSPHLETIIQELAAKGYHCEIQKVSYELQRGGNEMLKITKSIV